MTLQQGANPPVAATLSYNSPTHTVTLDPNADLQAGLTYTATIAGGSTGVRTPPETPCLIRRPGHSPSSPAAAEATRDHQRRSRPPRPSRPGRILTASPRPTSTVTGSSIWSSDISVSSSVTVYKGNGDGTFLAGTSFTTGSATTPKNAVLADVEQRRQARHRHGEPGREHHQRVEREWRRNFGSPVQYAACSRPHEAAVGDLNGDGKPDVAVACWNGSVISVLLGNGNGTFAPGVDYGAGSARTPS